jgi:hypothetical protein
MGRGVSALRDPPSKNLRVGTLRIFSIYKDLLMSATLH